MTDARLITSGVHPSETNIEDVAVALVKGRPLVVCATHPARPHRDATARVG
ncbi:hypothetical protein [Streptomyces marincola]|uniref:hypothetical protein n=1 Tax=Streptomyces marincola TaxID=2878388 RepID=UPI001CF30629|nr:hypothetical protein [Streptomyces marincola]UCM89803.1 hypothetical protein LC193_18630 [Streptomyces marincola]